VYEEQAKHPYKELGVSEYREGETGMRGAQGGLTMTKSELIAQLSQLHPHLSGMDTELAVKTILEAMTENLVRGKRIEIRGFGSFSLNYRPPRVGRNPKTGEQVGVPAKYVPHFKAGKELRERVDS
jgi:integration host factor subunit beta